MIRTMLKREFRRATVTDLHPVGSVTIDPGLPDAADALAHDQVANGATAAWCTLATL